MNNSSDFVSSPLLSVCIPSYNRKDLLSLGLKKLLAYRGDDLEIVICDNASDDGAWEMICGIPDPRVRVFRQDENKGGPFNQLFSLIQGQGRYCMMMNDRDHFETEELGEFITFLKTTSAMVVMAGAPFHTLPFDSVRNRTVEYMLHSHPGKFALAQEIVTEGREQFRQTGDFVMAFYAYITKGMLSDEWQIYPGDFLIKEPDDLGSIKAHCIGWWGQAYFTPHGAIGQTLDMLRNPFPKGKDKTEYIKGIYWFGAHRILKEYSDAVKFAGLPNAISRRYPDFHPPEHENYLRVIAKFYKEICKELKEQQVLTIDLKNYFLYRSIKTYLQTFVTIPLALQIKKVLPKSAYTKVKERYWKNNE